MIQGFGDRDTEAFANGDRVPAFQGFEDQARRRLQILNAAKDKSDLRQMRSNRFEALRGQLAGRYSIRINRQYRIVFEWPDDAPGPLNVTIMDYH